MHFRAECLSCCRARNPHIDDAQVAVSNLFFQLGRRVGHAAIPALRKSKSVWNSLTREGGPSVLAEAEFGRSLATELRLKAGLSQDEQTRHFLQEIADRLTARVRNKDRTFKVEVLRDTNLTALALPGGFLFISVGLLSFCERKSDELAFVIGHEMGHVVRGHALERVLLRIGSEGLTAILSRGLIGPMLRDVGLGWLQGAYRSDAELEADEFGVRIAAAAGYQAEAATEFLDRLAKACATGPPLGEYVKSHPAPHERIAAIRTLLQSR